MNLKVKGTMIRKLGWLSLFILMVAGTQAQKKNFTYKFYGQVRGDLFYNSRASNENVDGLFYLYPKDHSYDAEGKDLNAQANGSFYVLYTRLGADLTGPSVGKFKTSAKIEADFRGSGSSFAMLRIRHAYVQLANEHSSVLIGQTWHPFKGDVFPEMLNLSTGAPFNAFSRAPQVRYRYKLDGWQLTGSALWQLQYLSAGPSGKSESYMKNSCIPEFHVGVDYNKGGFQWGAGALLLSLVPRTQNTIDGKVYKLNERITTLSFEAHALYKNKDWKVAAKSTLGSNMTHTSMLGGYGVTTIDSHNGEQQYTPFRVSTTWLNIVHGNRWKEGLFIGYLKNLGTAKEIVNQYGVGLDVGQLAAVNAQISYNLPHWKLGIEYNPAIAWYGSSDNRGKIHDTHSVVNHRILWAMLYMF